MLLLDHGFHLFLFVLIEMLHQLVALLERNIAGGAFEVIRLMLFGVHRCLLARFEAHQAHATLERLQLDVLPQMIVILLFIRRAILTHSARVERSRTGRLHHRSSFGAGGDLLCHTGGVRCR
uniref:Putative secreted protein n=1 Tax=Anopheles triannulatus TaxID=58253 RepID=A0A2M4B2I1_9DIPT